MDFCSSWEHYDHLTVLIEDSPVPSDEALSHSLEAYRVHSSLVVIAVIRSASYVDAVQVKCR